MFDDPSLNHDETLNDGATELFEHVRFYAMVGETMIEADVIITTPEQWRQLPQSHSSDWRSVPTGPVIVAQKIVA